MGFKEGMFDDCFDGIREYANIFNERLYVDQPKPARVEGVCCGRCVHRIGDKMSYCEKHKGDYNCFRFKLDR